MAKIKAYEPTEAVVQAGGLSGGTISVPPNGDTLDLVEQLEIGNGKIVTANEAVQRSLDSLPAFKSTAVDGAPTTDGSGEDEALADIAGFDVEELRGRELDAALEARDLPKHGSAVDKRQRIFQYESERDRAAGRTPATPGPEDLEVDTTGALNVAGPSNAEGGE